MDSIIEFSHFLLSKHLGKDDITLDMTLGNGNDALFLTEISKFVYCFDIQEEACRRSGELLVDKNNYKIINDSHSKFTEYVSEEFSGAIFNLGFLPGGDKCICTNAEIVLKTLKKILLKIKKNGIIVLVFYPGHPSGLEEVMIVGEYLKGLDQRQYDVLKYEFVNQVNNPPFLMAVKIRI